MTGNPLHSVALDEQLCTQCGKCVDACPTGVFQLDPDSMRVQVSYPGDCHVCFLCVPDCPAGAIAVSWDAPNRRQHSIYDILGIAFPDFQTPAIDGKGK
ncbi:MAG: ferredoxin family protein [Pseudomonadota bacterium]